MRMQPNRLENGGVIVIDKGGYLSNALQVTSVDKDNTPTNPACLQHRPQQHQSPSLSQIDSR